MGDKGEEGRIGGMYVHNPTIDIAEFFEAEEPCSVRGVIECEALERALISLVPLRLRAVWRGWG